MKTIRVSEKTRQTLNILKFSSATYDKVIMALIEASGKKVIQDKVKKAMKEIKQ